MLPSSGAWQFTMNGARRLRPHSAEIIAIPNGPRPSPPNSGGMCGSQRPRWRALRRSSMIPSRHWPVFCIWDSAGSISSLINARTRSRSSRTCAGILKSIDIRTYLADLVCVMTATGKPAGSSNLSLFRQSFFGEFACHLAIEASTELVAQRLHQRAHLGRAGGDGLGDRDAELTGGDLGREVS